ncbi:MAG: 23S rRNA (adenine(2030)-N(6))-methyltransferase RlmJ [Rhodospirillales bacterium]|nr:23S rRNA (adenine(2030)-N(6))-methyltransferase RlmJ [Rhodospirillales bacterium]
MNYRHAFHAGNFADVFKHAAFALILEYLKRKPAPFAVVDTHAGLGRYDLAAAEAERTGEWREGIGRVLESGSVFPGLSSLLKAVAAVNAGKKPTAASPPRWYPGSPRIARALLRKNDRLWCAELHPDDSRVLARECRGDPLVQVRHMDGYEAIRAWLPPSMRRGVVLVDPPFESRDEFRFLLKGLKDGHRRFATGIFVLWYPIKDRAPVEAFHKALAASGIRRILAAELLLRLPDDSERLQGCGLIVVNPPWRLDRDLAELTAGLAGVLGGDSGGLTRPGEPPGVRWLAGE